VGDNHGTVAYFTMEIGLEDDMPTYAGGLGVLAGDTVRAGADLGLPMVAVSLLHRQGYVRQAIESGQGQTEFPAPWHVEDRLDAEDARCSVHIEGREVVLRAWRYDVTGATGAVVPVHFLDADMDENDPRDRGLTGRLYGGDQRYRIAQETVLGVGGVRMLRALGHRDVAVYHMNEGHAAFLVPELLGQRSRITGGTVDGATVDAVRERCVFTTHTPVPAGHDHFPVDLARSITGDLVDPVLDASRDEQGELNMTRLALAYSRYVNGVAQRHGEVSRDMFPGHEVDAITNGVHAATWAAPPLAALFDEHARGWRVDGACLRNAMLIPLESIRAAHEQCKRALIDRVNAETGAGMNAEALTLGFARRATPYKRGTLLFADIDRLHAVASAIGGLQVVYAGKAHPADEAGKDLIREILRLREVLGDDVRIAYLADYGMTLGGMLTSGVDVWLNTPRPPLEASGTSGMKAALNGVPSLSVLDGWWLEGCIEGVTGWAIGVDRGARAGDDPDAMDREHAESLYGKLEHAVGATHRDDPDEFARIRRNAIAINGSWFHTQRMLRQYVMRAYGIS
jgi:starch phosphorylase